MRQPTDAGIKQELGLKGKPVTLVDGQSIDRLAHALHMPSRFIEDVVHGVCELAPRILAPCMESPGVLEPGLAGELAYVEHVDRMGGKYAAQFSEQVCIQLRKRSDLEECNPGAGSSMLCFHARSL